jgi:gamma-glutamylcyclotransferase (GGCT)/AIG2-like uncharacterized protein YtfP
MDGLTKALFTYGTLMLDNVMLRMANRETVPQKIEGEIKGYERLKVVGAHYPGIRKSKAEDVVKGVLWTGLTETDMEHLDRYEGDIYYQEEVDVHTSDGIIRAIVYVFIESPVHRLEGEWDLSHCKHLVN